MEEHVTLILDENRIDVKKGKLASKSRYFASLFSHNFNDSHNKEHVINYDIALQTLQNFVEWIHDDKERVDMNCHSIKNPMTIFLKDNFTELLKLLQLSVLFMVDELTDDAIEIIVLCWLVPDKVIEVWLLAQDLNIKVLQDICLAVCLDRFHELPLLWLVELTKDNITQLIENVNVRSSTKYLQLVRNKWMQHHMTSDIADIKEEKHLTFLRGIVVYDSVYTGINTEAYLYTWNGNVLSKCTRLKNMQDSVKWINGMQVVGRGFSIYTVGGEMGLGTGQFNKSIWRYCLISKKWYYQSRLLVPRRHMVAVFLKNTLVIAGGVGRHRLKLSSVDILDIHTGEWRKGAKVPECFTEIPPHCVMNGKLFFMKSSVYIYHPEDNYWETILIYNNPVVPRVVDAFLTPDATLFLTGEHLGEKVLSRVDIVEDTVCEREECLKQGVEHSIITNASIVHEDDSCQLRCVHVAGIAMILLDVRRDDKHQYLHLRTEMKRDFKNAFIPLLGCFNIIDPDTLYNTV